jgi:hypothetical protein
MWNQPPPSDPTKFGAPAAAAPTKSLWDKLTDDPLKLAGGLTAGGLLGYTLLKQNQANAGVPPVGASATNLSNIAGPSTATGAKLTETGLPLTQYLGTTTLPGPEQAALDNATNAAVRNKIGQYASRGQDVSRNPDGSYKNSVLGQEIDQINQNKIVAMQKMQTDLANTGVSLINAGRSQAQLSEDIYKTLIGVDQTQTQQTSQAIANLAAALSGGRGTTIKVG